MIVIPIGHEQAVRRFPYVTISLIGLNVLIFLITFPLEIRQTNRIVEIAEKLPLHDEFLEKLVAGEPLDIEEEQNQDRRSLYEELRAEFEGRVFYRFGYKPGKPSLSTLIASLFLHGGFFHLLSNMFFLWLVGCNMEDDWGRPVFTSLYFVGGMAAALAHHASDPSSLVPMIGASGAISAVMGAFMIRHYKTRIRFGYAVLLFLRPFVGTFRLYAWVALGLWFLQQLFYGLITQGAAAGVAFWAHVGGFLLGTAAGVGFKFFRVEEKFLAPKLDKEAVRLSSKLLQAFHRRDKGDLLGAIALLRHVVREEPRNVDARLELARCLLEGEAGEEAAPEFERAIETLLAKGEVETALDIYGEISENGLEERLGPRTRFGIGAGLAAQGDHESAVQLFASVAMDHPRNSLVPLALLRCGKILLKNLDDKSRAKGVLTHLLKNYPGFEGREEATRLLKEIG